MVISDSISVQKTSYVTWVPSCLATGFFPVSENVLQCSFAAPQNPFLFCIYSFLKMTCYVIGFFRSIYWFQASSVTGRSSSGFCFVTTELHKLLLQHPMNKNIFYGIRAVQILRSLYFLKYVSICPL